MRMLPFRLLGFFFTGIACAFAHDPFEITSDAWIRAQTFEISSTLARSTAAAIVEKSQTRTPFDAAKFEEWKPRLEEAAREFYVISANGKPLPFLRATAELTIEQDVELKFVYARPPVGTLEVRAPHVVALGYGYGNVFTAHGEKGALLGQELLSESQPAMQVTVTEAAAPAPAESAADPKLAPKPEAQATDEPDGLNLRAAIVAVLVVVAIVWWLRRRQRKPA